MQLPAFVVFENVPARQLVHTRSLVVDPAVETYVPAEHVDHVRQDVLPGVVLNVPAAHAVHDVWPASGW